MTDYSKRWTKEAKKLLLGKKIVKVKYMQDEEVNNMHWENKAVCLLLDDGNWIFPMRDDEGNGPGALAVGNKDTLPVL
tara:strand:- start:273 stop:506 length:234 start_codon:yes stop_codon:yes gene_type:complete